MLYHGSKVSGLRILRAQPHVLVGHGAVVFATTDKRFALAMIHAVDEVVSVGYFVDTDSHNEVMYLEERVPNGFDTLAAPGVLYAVADEGFVVDHRLSHTERISRSDVPVMAETYIPDVRAALQNAGIEYITYSERKM